jgi:hypothetical protein
MSQTISVIDNYVKYLEKIASELNDYQNNLYDENQENESTDSADSVDSFEKYQIIYKSVTDKFNSQKQLIEDEYNLFQSRPINDFYETGITHGKLDNNIQLSLLNLINDYASRTKVDYHPGSNNKVRDLVHPSVYPYVKNEKAQSNKLDFFKRPYESSKYQWLPSEFQIDSAGKCEIKSYINNLPLDEKPMYEQITKLFDSIGQELSKAYSYALTIDIFNKKENLKYKEHVPFNPINFTNQNLQVITKIVQVTLEPGESLLGSWHVEGMGHENIIATASCTLEQPDGFEAELYFKRTYYSDEAGYLMMNTYQHPHESVIELYHKNLVPVGKVNIKSGSLVVFPNNFVHKVDMRNNTESPLTRTILVFWLINPLEKIKSTNDIPQQVWDWEQVNQVRLELMKEKTYYKQSFNQREINLCEH